jgi:hypothetical protein
MYRFGLMIFTKLKREWMGHVQGRYVRHELTSFHPQNTVHRRKENE